MARHITNTVPYYPEDTHLNDYEEYIFNEHGHEGICIILFIKKALGSSENHYVDLSDIKKSKMFVSKCKSSIGKIISVIEDLCDFDFLDKDLWNKKQILWSDVFIKDVSVVYMSRKRALPQKPFSKSFPREKGISLREISITPREIAITPGEIPQSRVEENRVEKSREEESRKIPPNPPGGSGGGNYKNLEKIDSDVDKGNVDDQTCQPDTDSTITSKPGSQDEKKPQDPGEWHGVPLGDKSVWNEFKKPDKYDFDHVEEFYKIWNDWPNHEDISHAVRRFIEIKFIAGLEKLHEACSKYHHHKKKNNHSHYRALSYVIRDRLEYANGTHDDFKKGKWRNEKDMKSVEANKNRELAEENSKREREEHEKDVRKSWDLEARLNAIFHFLPEEEQEKIRKYADILLEEKRNTFTNKSMFDGIKSRMTQEEILRPAVGKYMKKYPGKWKMLEEKERENTINLTEKLEAMAV